MRWLIPILIEALVTYAIYPYIFKRYGTGYSIVRRICVMYAMIALATVALVLPMGGTFTDPQLIPMFVLGLANFFAVYAYQKAIEISLSQTALFTQGDDLIGLGLAMAFLGEVRFLNSGIMTGIALCLGSAGLFAVLNARSAMAGKDGTPTRSPLVLYGYIAAYSVIWGVVMFAIRYWAVKDVAFSTFAMGWYGGSAVSSALVYAFVGKEKRGEPLTRIQIKWTALIGFLTWLAMLLYYWVKQTSPMAVNQPIMQVGEMVVPALIGLCFFREGKNMRWWGWVLFGTALIGGLVIALSYS